MNVEEFISENRDQLAELAASTGRTREEVERLIRHVAHAEPSDANAAMEAKLRSLGAASHPPGHPNCTYARPKEKPFVAPDEPGRNDPCHCGSGKKYKRCCLRREP